MMHALAVKQSPEDELGGIYNQDDEQERLAEILEERYHSMLRALQAVIAAAFPELEQFRLTDDAVNRILIEAASRVVRIDEVTRRAIAEQLRLGQALGLSPWEIANGRSDLGYGGIEGLFTETWAGRALTVARSFAHCVSAIRIVRSTAANRSGTSGTGSARSSRISLRYPASTIAMPGAPP